MVAVRLPITWHDVGGFAALGEQLPRDQQGNATQGASVLVDAHDNLVINNAEPGRLVAVVGLSDTVIVQTPQITLVCPMSEAERVKELVAQVTSQLGLGLRLTQRRPRIAGRARCDQAPFGSGALVDGYFAMKSWIASPLTEAQGCRTPFCSDWSRVARIGVPPGQARRSCPPGKPAPSASVQGAAMNLSAWS